MVEPLPSFDIEIDLDPPAAAPSSAPAVNERLGHYRLRHQLATGGMATVYLAVPDGATSPDEIVALKRVHPHLAAQRSFVEMFLDEARLGSQIAHPNVCRVLDWGRAGGSYYLAMEYLRGEPFARVMRKLRGLGQSDASAVPVLAARLCAQAARGLHAAHELTDEQGRALDVVHRDVSPHNLFVTYDGQVQIVDFGIARARGRLHQTETGTIKGKFAYMAPEQMVGMPVDRRADVYSLGVVLWELLAGRPLYRRKTESETVLAVTKGHAPPLAEVAPDVPAELAAIAERAIAREPSLRQATAREFADALERWLQREGGHCDGAEVAAWMHVLFPGASARAQELAASLLAIPEAGPPARPDATGASASGIRRRSAPAIQAQPPPRDWSTAIALSLAAGSLILAAAMAAWHVWG